MKSFRLYREPPVITPSRLAPDYTAEELAVLRNKFEPLATEYRKQRRISRIGSFGFISGILTCIILGAVLGKSLTLYQVLPFWLAAIGFWVFGAFFDPGLPPCPACHNSLEGGLGDFCPGCGSAALSSRRFFFAPRCQSCGKVMRTGKGGRQYKIRACSHCGVSLDNIGL